MSAGLAINAVWAVTLWSLCATGVVFMLRRCRSAIRRDVCRLALVGVPVVLAGVCAVHAWRPEAGLVDWRVAPAVACQSAEPSLPVPAPVMRQAVAAFAPSRGVAEARPAPDPEPELLAEPVAEPGAMTMPLPAPTGVSAEPAPVAVSASPAGPNWASIAVLAAVTVTAVLLAGLVRRVAILGLWRRTWRPASGAWGSLARRLAGRMGLGRRFSVYVVPGLGQPAAAGVFRPAILLPDRSDARVTPALRGALLHELGHLAGRDPMWGLIGLGAAALAWWCPAVWLLHRWAQVQGEMTADDCALSSGTRPTDLAKALLEFAERIQQSPVPAAVPGMGCYLKRRVEMMIDENRPHESEVSGHVRWLLGLMALALVVGVAVTPLVGVAAAPEGEVVAQGAEAPAAPAAAEPAEPAESSVAVAIVRNRAQMAAARKERDKVRSQIYALRHKFDKHPALTELRQAAGEASKAYEAKKETDPAYKEAKAAERVLDEALDVLVLAKLKASPEGVALLKKLDDLEEERASLSVVYAIAEVKLTHRDSAVARALGKDTELAKLYKVYRASEHGPVRDRNRSAYYAAKKVALARLPQAVALTEEMASAKKGMDAAYKAHYEAGKELRKLESGIKYDKSDAEIAAAYAKRSEAGKVVEKAYESGPIQAARELRSQTYRALSAKLKELMVADPEASALQRRYEQIDKEIDDLEDEAKELKRKQKSAPKKAPEGEASVRRAGARSV